MNDQIFEPSGGQRFYTMSSSTTDNSRIIKSVESYSTSSTSSNIVHSSALVFQSSFLLWATIQAINLPKAADEFSTEVFPNAVSFKFPEPKEV